MYHDPADRLLLVAFSSLAALVGAYILARVRKPKHNPGWLDGKYPNPGFTRA